MHESNFESWSEFIDKADRGESELSPSQRQSRSLGSSFTETASWEDAMRLARQGWAEGAKNMQANLELVSSKIPAKKMVREFEMSRVGPGVFDFNRIRMGHPQPWITMKEYEVDDFEGSKIVKIAFNGTASAGVSTSEMFNKGALIGALADLLERSGRRVEILLMMGSRGRKTEAKIRVMLKRAQDPLDIDRLAFALAHASTLRRFGFSLLEQMPHAKQEGWSNSSNYGHCIDWDEEGCINVRSSDMRHLSGEQERMEWLKKQLSDQGIDWNEN